MPDRPTLWTTAGAIESAKIGEPKVVAASEAAVRLNPELEFRPLQHRITAETSAQMLKEVDVVIDGSDNFATRLIVNDLCLAARVDASPL